jgi:hypothetical protein
MPLLDNFRPPVSDDVPWQSFNSGWATHIADALNDCLPTQFLALEYKRPGKLEFDARVVSTGTGRPLIAAIELVSPGNKDRPEERTAFAAKCASYLHSGVSLIIMDIVTDRRFNLHNELMRLMNAAPNLHLPAEAHLYAVAYRPVLREERPEIDLWPTTFQLGDALPLLPLRLTDDLFVPVDFEATYQETCRRRRIA